MANKLLALAVTATLAMGVSACSPSPEPEQEASDRTVTLALSTEKNPFFLQVRYGAQAKANELGLDLNVVDAGDDPAVQEKQLAEAGAQSKVVIVNPTDSDEVRGSVEKLNEKGVPVITLDRAVNGGEVAAHISSDNVEGGRDAAAELARSIREQGEVIVLTGLEGSSSSEDRLAGFQEKIASYPKINVVVVEAADFERSTAREVVQQLLAAHPDVAGIFAENDEMALGAVEALGERAGKDVKVIGFDGTEEGVRAVKNRKLIATVAQLSSELGARAVEEAGTILDGGTPDKEIATNVVVVTRDNIEKYRPL